MHETLYRSQFNKFLNSKEGKNYYLGVVPPPEKKKVEGVQNRKGKRKNGSADSQGSCPSNKLSSQGSVED